MMDSYNPNIEFNINTISETPTEELKNVRHLLNRRSGKRSASTKLVNSIYPRLSQLSREEKQTYVENLKKIKLDLEQLDDLISEKFALCSDYNFGRQEEIDKHNVTYQVKLGVIINTLINSLEKANENKT